MTYILQPLIGEWTAWDDETRAEAEQVGMLPRLTVIWWCSGLEPPETPLTGAVAAETVVERVLGHLGVRLGLEGEIG